MTTAAIIVAAGRGQRAGTQIPKQWCDVAGKRVADWTVAVFQSHELMDELVLVVHPSDLEHADKYRDIRVVTGGETRDQSVRRGLEALADNPPDKVLIHDVARPCVSDSVVTNVINALDYAQCAAPAVAVTDALWRVEGTAVGDTVSREGLFRAQTPQGFRYPDILTAHREFDGIAADDVEIARKSGMHVELVYGHEDNLKITAPDDFARAERILTRKMDIRLGNGYDVHRFGEGDHVVLCGVEIAHDKGLQGHSDADVGMHAVTDAIYGALAEGDIGRHFPPSDPQWKGADSQIFLDHAVKLAASRGFAISNIDCTLVCEFPKIGPHADKMQKRMAEILQVETTRVSIKATTSERLGFTGRGEGIAALATASLVAS